MVKTKKIIIAIAIIIVIIIICIISLLLKKNKDTVSGKFDLKMNVEQELDVTKVYNIDKCINNMVQDIFKMGSDHRENILLTYSITQKFEFKNSPRTFYIKKAYKAEMQDDIIVYFVEGYIADTQNNIVEKNTKITVVYDTEYNTCRLYSYGEGYTNIIKYDDDISKTELKRVTGLKVKKTNNEKKNLDEYIMEDDFFKRNLFEEISHIDLITWYFKDYIINNFDAYNVDFDSFSYEGNYEEGYEVTLNNGDKYYIKPGEVPMDYQITKK